MGTKKGPPRFGHGGPLHVGRIRKSPLDFEMMRESTRPGAAAFHFQVSAVVATTPHASAAAWVDSLRGAQLDDGPTQGTDVLGRDGVPGGEAQAEGSG